VSGVRNGIKRSCQKSDARGIKGFKEFDFGLQILDFEFKKKAKEEE
jgi:hypothetical protein